MKRAAAWVAVGAAVMAGAGAFAWAQPVEGRNERQGRRMQRGPERVAEYLGLTEQQREAWKSLREKHRQQAQALHQEGRTLREQVKAALAVATPDPLAVGKATIALEAHRKKMQAQREAFQAQLAETLTPEQKEKWEALEAARGALRGPRGMRGMRGMRGQRGPGAPDGPGGAL
jgi:Spy/CpxP family protein refolding chaperone